MVAAAGTIDPARTAVDTITTRYDGARYSDQPATAEDAAAARAAWEVCARRRVAAWTPRPEQPRRDAGEEGD